MVVDSTTGHGALSFMDGSSGYNQIKMDEDDAIDTTFRTPRGNFQYTVMPFGLKKCWCDLSVCNSENSEFANP